MKHKLTDNWGLKLGSLVISFFIWIIVTNMNDPVISFRVTNVPVRLINTGLVTDNGQTYEVLDDTDVIDVVTVSAPRSVIDALSEENVVAVADFGDMTMQNTIPIKLSTNKYNTNLESIKGSVDSVKLNIEELKSKTLALSVATAGTVSDGYIVGNVTAAQNQVRISGPQSVIERVVRAEASVSVTGFTQDIITDTDITLVDAEGERVVSDTIESNIKTVKVNVELLQTKYVDLEFSFMGTPAEGYAATGEITSNPEEILVAGRAAILKTIDKISVDTEALNVTGLTGNMLALIDIEDYLPSGVNLADPGFDGKVTVTVFIEQKIGNTLNLSPANIQWTDVPSEYKPELVDPEEDYSVTIMGLQKDVGGIKAADVVAVADLSDILEQEDRVGSLYHCTLRFMLGDQVLETKEPVQVWFKLDNT